MAILAFFPGGLLVPVTIVGTGILLWRTHAYPWWSATLLVGGGALFVIGRPERITALTLTADLVLFLALAPIGSAVLTAGREVKQFPAT